MHCQVEAELASAREDGLEPSVVGERMLPAFMKLLPFFKMYSTYCAGYPNMSGALAEARANRAAEAIISKAHTPLEQLLFRPVQRMCVYPLLFKEALKYAEEGEQQAPRAMPTLARSTLLHRRLHS